MLKYKLVPTSEQQSMSISTRLDENIVPSLKGNQVKGALRLFQAVGKEGWAI
jgi:hypothetical protein